MPTLRIYLDGTAQFQRLADRPCYRTDKLSVTALEGGMQSGDPSVAIIIEPPDGPWILAETSLKLFLVAADALKAKYGDPRQEPGGSA